MIQIVGDGAINNIISYYTEGHLKIIISVRMLSAAGNREPS